jgi:hypothetical protein
MLMVSASGTAVLGLMEKFQEALNAIDGKTPDAS